MPDTPAPLPIADDADDPQLGLSLSELLGEVWAPVGRRDGVAAGPASAPVATDLDSGDPATWNH